MCTLVYLNVSSECTKKKNSTLIQYFCFRNLWMIYWKEPKRCNFAKKKVSKTNGQEHCSSKEQSKLIDFQY